MSDSVEGEPDPSGWYRPSRVQLEAYNPRWVRAYESEQRALVAVLGEHLVAIEHVGSTAVPGTMAKPIIDIALAVTTWNSFAELDERLKRLRYRYTPESETEDDPVRRVFRKGPADFNVMRTHHLHVTLADSHDWRRLVGFRDWLRSHPDDAASYVALKQQLLARHAQDSRSYTSGKTTFVASVEHRACIHR